MSVVIRCRTADGRPAVVKLSPERERVSLEAAALAGWRTVHVPSVLAVDESVDALMIEAIQPGTPLVEMDAYPSLESIASLLRSLHENAVPAIPYRPVADRIANLFESSMKLYEFKPDLIELISPELYERSRELALRLAADAPAAVLLHGDLTPVNVLDGGTGRGLVAIDPAPCMGDPAFDAIDLVFWRAGCGHDHCPRPAPGTRKEADANRLIEWCTPSQGWWPWKSPNGPAAPANRSNPSSCSHRAFSDRANPGHGSSHRCSQTTFLNARAVEYIDRQSGG